MKSGATRMIGAMHVYVSSAGDGCIHVMRASASGDDVTEVQRLSLGGAIMPLAFSPDGRWLHAIDRKEPFRVHTLAVDPDDGTLTPLSHAPLAGNMVQARVTPDGRWLLSASYGEDRIAANPLLDNGQAGAPSQVCATLKQAHAICPTPSGRHAWVSCLGADRLLAFGLDTTQATSPLSPEPLATHVCRPGSGPRHLAFHPHRPWLFVINELDGTLDLLAFDEASLSLTPRASARILPDGCGVAPWSAELRISASGEWLFASDRRAALIRAFRLQDHPPSLTPVGHIETEALPRSFAASPCGSTLFVASQESGRLSVIGFDAATGQMRLRQQLDCGPSPTWVEIRPTGAP